MTSVPHSGAKSVTPGGSVAGHTPGPWTYSTEPHPNGCPIIGHEGLMIAMLAHSVNHEDQKEEALANARLIAAAPELLEAMTRAANRIDHMSLYLEGPESRRLDALDWTEDARAAIAKATAGETRNAEPIHRRDGDEG